MAFNCSFSGCLAQAVAPLNGDLSKPSYCQAHLKDLEKNADYNEIVNENDETGVNENDETGFIERKENCL